jgi:hypothetical protein
VTHVKTSSSSDISGISTTPGDVGSPNIIGSLHVSPDTSDQRIALNTNRMSVGGVLNKL